MNANNRKIETEASGGTNYYTTGATLGGDNKLTGSTQATTWIADLSALAGGGGTIGGSITNDQVAFGATTANSIEGSANLTYTSTGLKVGSSSATGQYIFVERDPSDTTYDFLYGKAKYPRITFEDTQASATQAIWHLGNQLRFGTNAGSSTTAAMYVQNGQPSDGLAYGFVAMNSGVGMGTTSSINSSRVSIVDTAKPLTLAYDGSNYTTFKVSSGGALTIDAGNDINLDTYTGVNNFLYRGTEKFRITAGS